MKTFEINKTYEMRFANNTDQATPVRVIARNGKTLKLELNGKIIVKKVKVFFDEEICQPLGNYSMAPQIMAGKLC